MLRAEYISQVLRDRGVRPPDVPSIRRFLSSLPGPEVEAAGALVHKIAQGVERADDIELLVGRIRGVPTEAPRVEADSAVRRPERARPKADTGVKSDQSFLRAHGIHVYGQQAALKIELDTPGAQDGAPPEYTLLVDGARKTSGEGYNWAAKIPFQLTRRELPMVAAFLLGYSSQKHLDFKYHGPSKDKSLHLADQGANLFVKLGRGGQAFVTVPVLPPDVYAWGELCLVALQLNRPTVGAEAQLALLKRIGQMTAQEPK